MFKVEITEHDHNKPIRSWINEFTSFQDAADFVQKTNKVDVGGTVPDIFYTAEYLGEDSKQLTLKSAVEKMTKYLEDYPEFSDCRIATAEWYDTRICRGGHRLLVITPDNDGKTVLYL